MGSGGAGKASFSIRSRGLVPGESMTPDVVKPQGDNIVKVSHATPDGRTSVGPGSGSKIDHLIVEEKAERWLFDGYSTESLLPSKAQGNWLSDLRDPISAIGISDSELLLSKRGHQWRTTCQIA